MSQPASSAPGTQLAQQMRQRFVAEVGRAMVELVAAVQERLTTLLNEAAPSREMQSRRDIWTLYQSRRNAWLEGTLKDWRLTLSPPALAPKKSVENGFELVGTEVVENKIVASRLVLHVMEKVSLEFNDLRVRIKRLEGREDLEDFDILRPEVLLLLMIEQWAIVGMPRDAWPLVNEVAYKLLTERINQAYLNANNFLIEHGVMPTIALGDRVKPIVPTHARTGVSSPTTMAQTAPRDSADSAYQENLVMPADSLLQWTRMHAPNVFGQINHLRGRAGGVDIEATHFRPPSPALARSSASTWAPPPPPASTWPSCAPPRSC